jgi:hypothetical protein
MKLLISILHMNSGREPFGEDGRVRLVSPYVKW